MFFSSSSQIVSVFASADHKIPPKRMCWCQVCFLIHSHFLIKGIFEVVYFCPPLIPAWQSAWELLGGSFGAWVVLCCLVCSRCVGVNCLGLAHSLEVSPQKFVLSCKHRNSDQSNFYTESVTIFTYRMF